MNRSFRAEESALRHRQQQQMGSLRSSGMKEKDEELTLFLEMRRREKDLLLQNSDEFDAPLGNKLLIFFLPVFIFISFNESSFFHFYYSVLFQFM